MSDRKVALITGASRGIGRAIAIRLAESGMDIAINYAGNEAAANEAVALCEKDGAKAVAFKADVADPAQVEELFNQVKETFGTVDVLVNNAGITRDGLLMSMKEEDFDAVVNTNLKGTFLCTKQATKIMLRKRAGAIVNMTSVVGIHGNAGQSNYSATKAGVIGFTKSVAKEVASRGIRVNAVAPGFIATDMTDVLSDQVKEAMTKEIPLARVGSPEDIANAVDFLVSDKATYITGQIISVDGGMNI